MIEEIKTMLDDMGFDVTEVTEESNLQDDLGFDSLDAVDLIVRIESDFGVEIPDSDAENCKTVGDLLKVVEKYKE